MTNAMRRFGLAVAVVGLTVGAAGQARAGQAWTISGTSDYRNDSWAFGELFTVGASNINVTALGAYDADGDGFTTPGGIPVGIYDETTNTLLASTNVLSGDPLVDGFRYDTIPTLTLLAGHQYDVVAVNEEDLYNIGQASLVVDPSVTLDGFRYSQSTVLTDSSTGPFVGGSDPIWMSDFQISPAAVPEPATVVSAGIAALMGLAYAWRRKRLA